MSKPAQNQQKNSRRDRETPKINNTDTRVTSLTILCYHNPVPVSHPAVVSTFWLQADKRQHSRYFLTLQIKQYLRFITVKQISHSQTKFTYPKSDTKSLYSLQSHPSGSNLLILFFFKSSRLFKFFISIGTIC